MELPSRELIANHVRIMQIIVAALIMGCVTLALIVVVIKSPPDRADGDPALVLTGMALAFGALALAGQLVIAPLFRKLTRHSLIQQEGASPDDPTRLLTGYQTSIIVTAAFAEGACFFNLVAYLIEGSPYTLGMAAVLVLAIAARFPTVGAVSDWLEREMRLVKEERETGRRA